MTRHSPGSPAIRFPDRRLCVPASRRVCPCETQTLSYGGKYPPYPHADKGINRHDQQNCDIRQELAPPPPSPDDRTHRQLTQPQTVTVQRIVLLAIFEKLLSTLSELNAFTAKYQVAGDRFSTTALVKPGFGSWSTIDRFAEFVP